MSLILSGADQVAEAVVSRQIDAVFVRPAAVDESDGAWSASVEEWRDAVRRMSGNRVEVLEVGSDEIAARLSSKQQVWRDIRNHGLVVHGLEVDQLEARRSA